MTDSTKHLTRRFARAVLDAAIGSTPYVGPILSSEAFLDAAIDSFLKTANERQSGFQEEAKRASDHLASASDILSTLQTQLVEQQGQLDEAIADLKATKEEAEHYAVLARTNRDLANAFVSELETKVRAQFEEERKRHLVLRRVASLTLWVVSLLLGALAGVLLDRNWEQITTLI